MQPVLPQRQGASLAMLPSVRRQSGADMQMHLLEEEHATVEVVRMLRYMLELNQKHPGG